MKLYRRTISLLKPYWKQLVIASSSAAMHAVFSSLMVWMVGPLLMTLFEVQTFPGMPEATPQVQDVAESVPGSGSGITEGVSTGIASVKETMKAWIDRVVLAFLRHGAGSGDDVIVVCNFTPVPRPGYRLGVPQAGAYHELFNSDATPYGGSGVVNLAPLASQPVPHHGREQSIVLTVPPLAAVILRTST